MSTGPFRVAVFLANRKLLLQANPDYRSELDGGYRLIRQKPGEEAEQGIGYLDDGTMIVVEGARNKIGRNLLISVTSFFRDADAFEVLKVKVIPELIKNKYPGG